MKAVGIDGCRFGWVAACYEDKTIKVCRSLKKLVESYGDDYHFLIDMPIGLASEQCKIRACEKETRSMLNNRKSSVFSVPCREAVHLASLEEPGCAENYKEAKETNLGILDRSISIQSWCISRKIKEVDMLLDENLMLRFRIRESHPEIAFQHLNGGEAMADNKKTKSGIKQRMDVLMRFEKSSQQLYNDALKAKERKEVARDDIIDALCLALTLKLSKGNLQTLPENPDLDEARITMAIHYYAPMR